MNDPRSSHNAWSYVFAVRIKIVNPAQGIKKNVVIKSQNFIFQGLALKPIITKMNPIVAMIVDMMGTRNTIAAKYNKSPS